MRPLPWTPALAPRWPYKCEARGAQKRVWRFLLWSPLRTLIYCPITLRPNLAGSRVSERERWTLKRAIAIASVQEPVASMLLLLHGTAWDCMGLHGVA
jgi:hypothetical protein